MRSRGRGASAAQNAAKKRGRYGRLIRVSSIQVRAVAGSRKVDPDRQVAVVAVIVAAGHENPGTGYGASAISRPKIWRRVIQPLMPPRLFPIWKRSPWIALTRCWNWLPFTRQSTMSRGRRDVLAERRHGAELTALDLADHAVPARPELHRLAAREARDVAICPTHIQSSSGAGRRAWAPRTLVSGAGGRV